MENLELTKEESLELEKRGFFVKEKIEVSWFYKLYWLYLGIIFGSIGFIGILGLIISNFIGVSLAILFGVLIFLIPVFFLIRATFYYIFIGKIFYTNNFIFAFRKKFKIGDSIKYINWINWSFIFTKQATFGQDVKNKSNSLSVSLISIGILLSNFLFTFWFASISIEFDIFLLFFLSALTFIMAYPIISYLLRQLVEHFHPLYAFGNLGEKIQSLTPQIESQSKLIQSEFEKDMNFSVLHSGFEKLSFTFSTIISLVLKLEKIEQKANNGNLFDSTKYINSLRSDIITPLISLKLFLEKQRQELASSQQELTRVRIGGSEVDSANIDLSSKRSESLMIELEKNIVSLDEMIEKMGK